ncbi:glucosyl-3-phosphoglycerate synthase [Granulicoccus sp. GXG6511]|uniref:glucosyl-3-phosphoglycerate synthase n=1 Tax=Granulicoccus sp. GXG6511 TaxID=3381351 RepID=UPI003D7CAD91
MPADSKRTVVEQPQPEEGHARRGQPAVDDWFRERTYRGADYSAEHLVGAKAGRRVSLVLPARNEQATVGVMVTAIRAALVERVPLIDELVVIDSDSTDDTAAVARAAGAEVHAQAAVLPELGAVPGKGEALWKSLAVTTGDIVGFVDSDLHDFDPQLVVGLLGPILTEDLAFVKGCYERPLSVVGGVVPGGGGRVTELVARPLINLYWPDLAGFVQPLAGEYAGRRDVLESVPFVGGYGVEIGLLIDVLERCGLDAMGQVDLAVRKHRNTPDAALAKMAMQIQRAVHERLVRQGRIVVREEPGVSFVQYARDDAGGFLPLRSDLAHHERPPMCDVRAGGGPIRP